jgi:hypothetical protein
MAYSRPPVQPGRALKRSPVIPVETTAGVLDFKLDADIATTTSLGVVQVGSGIDITPEGVISVGGSEAGCNTILVKADYESTSDDCYIGVNSSGPVTITLPVVVSDGHQIVVKSEMGPPVGNRKVTIATADGSLIDGNPTCVLSVPYESIHLIFRGFEWHII